MPVTALPTGTEQIALTQDGPVLSILLNRPDARNALSATMSAELLATFEALRTNTDVRVVVLRGAGGNFCAGGDIKTFNAASRQQASGGADEIAAANRRGGKLFQMIDETPQATIVVVEGFAMGGGFGMACLGDITLARADATFAMTEVMIGIVPAQISPFVVRRIGLTAARRFGVSGARLDGHAAKAVGIAHDVADDAAALDALIAATVKQVLRCAPGAVAATKALMHRAARGGVPMDDLLDRAALDFSAALRSEEGLEGTSAFVAKRKPAWAPQ
jgi:isohexenylglutaconyl-CoA hydratase